MHNIRSMGVAIACFSALLLLSFIATSDSEARSKDNGVEDRSAEDLCKAKVIFWGKTGVDWEEKTEMSKRSSMEEIQRLDKEGIDLHERNIRVKKGIEAGYICDATKDGKIGRNCGPVYFRDALGKEHRLCNDRCDRNTCQDGNKLRAILGIVKDGTDIETFLRNQPIELGYDKEDVKWMRDTIDALPPDVLKHPDGLLNYLHEYRTNAEELYSEDQVRDAERVRRDNILLNQAAQDIQSFGKK